MIELYVDRDDAAEELAEFNNLLIPKSIYDDVATLQAAVAEIIQILNNLQTDFVPEKSSTLTDIDLNTCIGKIIFGYGNGCLNKPTGSNGYLINIPHNAAPDKFNKQIWITRPTNNIFVRNMDDGVFGNWTPILFDTGWKELTLASGISPQNVGQYPCRYRKINNQVYVDGCVKNLNTSGTIVCTLPEGYRPSKSYYYQAATNAGKTDTFRVHTDGRIEWMATTGTYDAANYHFITTSFLID